MEDNRKLRGEKGKQNLIVDFGGVALADVLANGVVILLIVIIITLSLTKQKTEQEIEQSAEISAILARDIASSLVFNDLPSSPPAILHNYNCQRRAGPWRNEYERHDCLPWLYPIIELHDDYVRELNSNRIFRRGELLQEDNALDVYLRLLNPLAKTRVRVDIYSLDLYYLALSIMKENGARPSHWHFIGEGEIPPQGGIAHQNHQGDGESELFNSSAEGESDEEGEGANGDGQNTEEAANADEQGEGEEEGDSERAGVEVPDDVSLRSPDRIEELLPPGEGLSRGGRQQQEQRESLEQLGGSEGEEQSYGDSLAEALAEAIIDERGEGSSEFGKPSSLSIRFPSAGQQSSSEEGQEVQSLFEFPVGSSNFQNGKPVDYHIFMIIFLMEYLNKVDEVGFDRVNLQDALGQFLSGTVPIKDHPLLPLANKLKDDMRIAFATYKQSLINVEHNRCANCISKALISANTPLESMQLNTINAEAYPEQANIVNLRLRLFPYPDQGEETELLTGDTILLHPQVLEQKREGWYPAVIADPNIEDIVVGYVYGSNDGDNFYVEGDVNSLRLDSQSLFSVLPNFPLRRETILGFLYGGLALLIIAVFFYLIGSSVRRRSRNNA